MATIQVSDLCFGFDQQAELLFEQVDLNIDSSWKLGLVGRNGRGKTIFLNLLQQHYPFQGSIKHQLQLYYFPQTLANENQTINEWLDQHFAAESWHMERECRLLGLAPELLNRPFGRLSGGEQTKMQLASLFMQEEAFFLIDEPTNHLDLKGRKTVAQYLKKKQQGFIVVSHDRQFLAEVTDHTLAIERRNIQLYQGSFAVYEQERALREQHELAQNRQLKKEIQRLEKTVHEKSEWSKGKERKKYGNPKQKNSGAIFDTGRIGAKAAATMKRAKNLEQRMNRQITEKAQLLQNVETSEALRMNWQKTHHQPILRVEKFALHYEGNLLFQPISFELLQGEQLLLKGENGSGKSSFLRYLMGDFKGEIVGEIHLANHLKMSAVRQNYSANRELLTQYATEKGLDLAAFLGTLKKLGLERQAFDTPIYQLSKGQQKKVELATSLETPTQLYLWDEPINDLDIYNQDQLVKVIQTYQPTLIFTEHDQVFSEKVASKIIELREA